MKTADADTLYIKQFKKTDKLLEELEEYALQNKIPIMDWHACNLLEQLISIKKPGKVLEIGAAIGYSAIRIARCLAAGAQLHTIEKSTDNIPKAIGNIERAGLTARVKLIAGEAKTIIPELPDRYDFVFLDADKEDYLELFHLVLPLLERGGVIFIDNLLWHGNVSRKRVTAKFKRSTELIRQFNRVFMNHPALESMIYNIGDGIGVGVKKQE